MEKIYLDVPTAHRAYAERHGAVLDREDGRYFVVEEVPAELYSYLPKEPRHRNYVDEAKEQCTVCGAAMEIRERRRDSMVFYRCASCLNAAWT